MIKIGDRVKFISDTGVGIVRSIKNGIAQVEVDGFEIPALVSDIVAVDKESEEAAKQRIGPSETRSRKIVTSTTSAKSVYGKLALDNEYEDEPIDIQLLKRQYKASQKAQVDDQAPAIPKMEEPPYKLTDYNVLLAFVPKSTEREPEESDLDMYLVNDSTYQIFYSIGQWERGNFVSTISCGTIEADTKLKIDHFKRMRLANITNLHIALLPCKPVNYTVQSISEINIEMHPLKFVRPNNYVENDFFDERSLIFTLANNNKQTE